MKTEAAVFCDMVNKMLVGGTIVCGLTDPEESSWGFKVKKKGRIFNVWVDCDPEGNGPGAIDIEEQEDDHARKHATP